MPIVCSSHSHGLQPADRFLQVELTEPPHVRFTFDNRQVARTEYVALVTLSEQNGGASQSEKRQSRRCFGRNPQEGAVPFPQSPFNSPTIMEPLIRVKKHVPSGTIILNRPNKRNPLSRQMIDQLRQALDDLHQERKVRAVILTGAGSSFCSGADLQEIQDSSRQTDAWAQWHTDAVQYKELLEAMLLYPKPIIAAVNGPAVGSGAGLVLAADITLAAPEARFGLPEPRRGLVAGLVAPLLSFPNRRRTGSQPAADGPFSRGQ